MFMWLVVGLGNPGEQYAESRHNIGFMVTDLLAEMFPISHRHFQHWSHLYWIDLHTQRVLLIQPYTYMNRSGFAIEKIMHQYEEPLEHLIVIYDDLDLEPGCLRIRKRGGHGGHRGVQSLIEHLGTEAFIRIRIGIGRPSSDLSLSQPGAQAEVIDYVLQPFQPDEYALVNEAMKRSIHAIELIVNNQIVTAMNRYNRSSFHDQDMELDHY
jgi:PTH1 family peptidyl-tRNA hydrolase